MGAFVTGLLFLLVGAGVYVFNTESPGSKVTFSRFGLEFGVTETVAILLGLGLFFTALGAWRWLQNQEPLDDEGPGGEDTA